MSPYRRLHQTFTEIRSRLSFHCCKQFPKSLTKENHRAHSRRIYHSVTHQKTRILESQSILEADVASDAEREPGLRVKRELHDRYSCMRQRLDVELCFYTGYR